MKPELNEKLTKVMIPNSDLSIYKRESSYEDSLESVITLFKVTDISVDFKGEYDLFKIEYLPLFDLYRVSDCLYQTSFESKSRLSQEYFDFGNKLRKILLVMNERDKSIIRYIVDTLEEYLETKLVYVHNEKLKEKVDKMSYKYSHDEYVQLGISLIRSLKNCYSVPTLENGADLSISWEGDVNTMIREVSIIDTPNSLGVQALKIKQGPFTNLYYLKGSTVKDQYCNLLEEVFPLPNEYLIVIYYLLLLNQISLEYRPLKESLKIMTNNDNVFLGINESNESHIGIEISEGIQEAKKTHYIKLACILKGESPQTSVYQIILNTWDKFFPVGEYIVDYIGFNYFLSEVLRDFNISTRLHKLTIEDLVLKIAPSLAKCTFKLFKEGDYILEKEDISSTLRSDFTRCVEYKINPEDDKVYCYSVHTSPTTGITNVYKREVDLEISWRKLYIDDGIVEANIDKLEYLKENNKAVKKIFENLDNQGSEK